MAPRRCRYGSSPIPVRREGRVLGVIARNTNLLTVHTQSRLELTYLQSASDLAQMIAAGSFPFSGQQVDMDTSRGSATD